MRHKQYIELTKPRAVAVTNDPEGPTVNATVLKIVRWNSPDELNKHNPSIALSFMYGFLNSKGEFVPLENNIHMEFVMNIDPELDKETGLPLEYGINKATNIREKAGNWLDAITVPAEGQLNRVAGDFRVADLYNHLINKFGIQGTIKEYGK